MKMRKIDRERFENKAFEDNKWRKQTFNNDSISIEDILKNKKVYEMK